ncbi:MAG TPA: hypothetical protein PKY29_04405 [Ferruginibacter sp.]|nr:hypothetical protein [Ferruginibacter sp.]HRQ20530.1 hypothetical protein [Ferruginibacter sp.]
MKNLKLISSLVLILTALQGLIPFVPEVSGAFQVTASAIMMFLVQALTAWRQHVNSAIDVMAERFTFGMFLLATLGGLNELFNVVAIPEAAGQWIRFGITAATAIINLISPLVWPKKS